MEVKFMKKTNSLAVVSFVISLCAIIFMLVWPDGDGVILASSLGSVAAITGTVIGFVAKKKIKISGEKGNGIALAGIIIGIISAIFGIMSFLGFIAMQDINYNDANLCPMDNLTKDCIDNGDGSSTCRYMDVYDVPCSTDKLKGSQFKE